MRHQDQVLRLLETQIDSPDEVAEIHQTAMRVAEEWVEPLVGGGRAEVNGLIYGLVQSGKTGVLTVTGAIGADQGYRTIILLTSDNDPLYDQTLGRAREAFPGIDIISKKELKDQHSFIQRIKAGTSAIVVTKNSSILKTLIENLQKGRVKGLSCLIIDDEADQASLNTKAKKADGTRSAINERITKLRGYFEKNTYLQVTATPQALFLQAPDHDFRPKFTILSYPGADYVGGDDFFGGGSNLVREFPLKDIEDLSVGSQPAPRLGTPKSLLKALDVFMVGATFKRKREADQNCAFLCHVSTRKADHEHIVSLLRKYKVDLAAGLNASDQRVVDRLRSAYDDLASTHEELRSVPFKDILTAITFLSPGITVKLVNGDTDEDVAVRSPYNLFVGGNKLGRGVTIKNLLVSYYGRNPRSPQADTVLQHARMYGYRRGDLGLLRLFLPNELHTLFRAIHKMESALRDLIGKRSEEEFRGVYLEGGVSPTRRNILAPGAVGIYSGGTSYNPAQVVRDPSVARVTERIDKLVAGVPDNQYLQVPIKELADLVLLVKPDEESSERIWNSTAIAESIRQYANLAGDSDGYLYVDRNRGLKENRRETQGILAGGEAGRVPSDRITLFLLRTRSERGALPAWWPQLRFPDGRYAFAFAV